MRKLITLLFFFLLISNLQAQESVRHTVYFATNKAIISQSEQKKLDAFVTEIAKEFIETIEISGHADSDGSDLYNTIQYYQRREWML